MKQITIRNNESSLYQPQYNIQNSGKDTFNFYDDKNTNYTLSNTIDLEARSLMSSRMSKRYSRSLFEKGSLSLFKTNPNISIEENNSAKKQNNRSLNQMQNKKKINRPDEKNFSRKQSNNSLNEDQTKRKLNITEVEKNLSRKQSNKSLNENEIKKKMQIYDQLTNKTQAQSSSFQIDRLNYTEIFAKRVNYKGIILFEPNPYLLPAFRKDKKKHQTKVSDVSLILFNEYMKKSNKQKEKMAKQLQKQLAKEVDCQNSELNYMKKSEFKNNNFFNKNLKRKLIKNIAKQNVQQVSLSPSCKIVTTTRSLSEDQTKFNFSQTQNNFFSKDQENKKKQIYQNSEVQQNNYFHQNNQNFGYDPYGPSQQPLSNQSRRQSFAKQNRKLSCSENQAKVNDPDKNTGSKRSILKSIYKDRISNLSKILNEQKQNLPQRPQTAQVSGRKQSSQNINNNQYKTIHDQSFY